MPPRSRILVVVMMLNSAALYAFYVWFASPATTGHHRIRPHSAFGAVLGMFGGERTPPSGRLVPGSAGDVRIEDPPRRQVAGDGDDAAATGRALVVAVGGGITSRRVSGLNDTNMATKMIVFLTLLPSFCTTASANFTYRFYLAHDDNDGLFVDERRSAQFRRTFDEFVARLCAPRGVSVLPPRLIRCRHSGRPTWAQNDAMLDAYLDGADYFYRVNDDSILSTGGWTEAFVGVLRRFDPPLVGVVGPNHRGGNTAILTYDFVHRSHVDAFGFYYPRLFTDWWGDNWVTGVYRPNRSMKLSGVRVVHTMGMGQRYGVRMNLRNQLRARLDQDIATLNRYIEAVRSNKTKPDGRKVISMSLYGDNPRYIWGAIRNAQLVPVHMPEWTLRVYVIAEDNSNGAPSALAVPGRVLNKLRLLGAQIARVPSSGASVGVSPRDWRHLVIEDENVDYFLIRDADYRTSDREAAAVREWIAEAERSDSAAIHCIRDHPKHANRTIVDGLWGGRRRGLTNRPSSALLQPPNGTRPDSGQTQNFASWAESLSGRLLCHDSVSACDRRPPSSGRRSFPVARQTGEYVGRKYNEHQEPVVGDRSEPVFRDVDCTAPSDVANARSTAGTPPVAVTGGASVVSPGLSSSVSLSSVSPSRP